MIKGYGYKILKDQEYPDHYEYTRSDLDKILTEAKNLNTKIITTEKDYQRLINFNFDEIKYIKTELKIIDEEKLLKIILEL